jgi:hypothetical protein
MHRLTRLMSGARSLSTNRASRQPIWSDCILKNGASRRCRSRRDFVVGVIRCLRRRCPTGACASAQYHLRGYIEADGASSADAVVLTQGITT